MKSIKQYIEALDGIVLKPEEWMLLGYFVLGGPGRYPINMGLVSACRRLVEKGLLKPVQKVPYEKDELRRFRPYKYRATSLEELNSEASVSSVACDISKMLEPYILTGKKNRVVLTLKDSLRKIQNQPSIKGPRLVSSNRYIQSTLSECASNKRGGDFPH